MEIIIEHYNSNPQLKFNYSFYDINPGYILSNKALENFSNMKKVILIFFGLLMLAFVAVKGGKYTDLTALRWFYHETKSMLRS